MLLGGDPAGRAKLDFLCAVAVGDQRACSAILGFVGSGGLGYDLKIAMQWGQGRYDQVVGIFALLFLAIVVIDQISDRMRHILVKGSQR